MVDFPRRRGSYYYYLGEKFVSVTNVLSMLAKPALITWAGKQTAGLVLDDPKQYDTVEKAISGLYSHRDKAGERGTEAHNIAEHYANRVWQKPDASKVDKSQGIVNAYYPCIESFFRIMNPTIQHTEVNVYSKKYGYAGTADLIATIGGETWLIDYKTSKAVYPENGLQLAAYANADFILSDDWEEESDMDSAEVPIPTIDKTAVVLLKPNGQFIWHPVDGDFETFLALIKVWEWNKEQ